MRGERGRKRGLGWQPTFVLNAAQWHRAKRRGEGGPPGASTWRENEGAKGGPSMAVDSVGAADSGPRSSGTCGTVAARTREGGGLGRGGDAGERG
jgi:hypothetical protein